jgi:hypothetical protein
LRTGRLSLPEQQWFTRVADRRLVAVGVDKNQPALRPARRVTATEIAAASRTDGYLMTVSYRCSTGQMKRMDECVYRLCPMTVHHKRSQAWGAKPEQYRNDTEGDE